MFNRNFCLFFFCLCGLVENIDYYFLYCLKYVIIWNIIINIFVNFIDFNLLFYGFNYLSIVENE